MRRLNLVIAVKVSLIYHSITLLYQYTTTGISLKGSIYFNEIWLKFSEDEKIKDEKTKSP